MYCNEILNLHVCAHELLEINLKEMTLKNYSFSIAIII